MGLRLFDQCEKGKEQEGEKCIFNKNGNKKKVEITEE